MGFKEKYEEYKQRQEAKAFFRGNNSSYLKGKDLAIFTICSIALGFAGGLLYGIASMMGLGFSMIYLLIAYIYAKLINHFTDAPSMNVIIIALLGYMISAISPSVMVFAFSGSISYLFNIQLWIMAIGSFFLSVTSLNGIIHLLFVLLGAFEIYYLGK